MAELAAFWSHLYFGMEFFSEYIDIEFGKHHRPLFKALKHGERGQKINILAPRGSGKSVCMSIIYPLHCIFYREIYEQLGMMPDTFIFIVSQSKPVAASRVLGILRKIENDPRFENLVGKHPWGVNRAETKNGVLVVPQGRGGQVRGEMLDGRRPTTVITDDIDDPEKVLNPDVRAKDQMWFDTDLIRMGRLDGKTNFLNVDTLKHEDATAGILQNRTDWRTLFFQAIQHPANLWHPTQEDLWKQWEAIYTNMTLVDDQREIKAQEFYLENKAVMHDPDEIKELWPEVITYLNIRKEICNVGYFNVLRELQNSVHDPSRAIFDMDAAIKCSTHERGLLRTDGRVAEWSNIPGITVYLDWAGGKKLAENASACIVCIAWEKMPGERRDQKGNSIGGLNGYVIHAELMQVRPALQVAAMFDAMQTAWGMLAPVKNLKTRFVIEGFVQDTGNAQEEQYRRAFDAEHERRAGVNVRLEFYSQSREKFDRISSLEPNVTNGWLCFADSLSAEYVKQMRQFPTGDFVDAPDATEGAFQNRVTETAVDHEKRRKASRKKADSFKVKL